ncbi:MAG: translation initiation factor IF-6 [Desulfurococcaceae archaeon]|jgi:translation initiation factor 6
MVEIIKMSFFGNVNIGVYAYVNDKIAVLPIGIPRDDVEEISSVLGALPIEAKIAGTLLNGVFLAGNSYAIIVPHVIFNEELAKLVEAVKSHGLDITVYVSESRYTALGNLLACNNKGCIASPLIEEREIKKLVDVLGVEVVKARLVNMDVPGSVLVINDRGGVIHPDASDEDLKLVKDVVKIHVERATVNAGIPYVKSGLLANNKGVVVGGNTTGPELLRIKAGFEGGPA